MLQMDCNEGPFISVSWFSRGARLCYGEAQLPGTDHNLHLEGIALQPMPAHRIVEFKPPLGRLRNNPLCAQILE